MAAEKVKEEGEGQPAKTGRSGKMKPLMIVGGLMLVEAVGIFVVMKLISPAPHAAHAEEMEEHESDPFKIKDDTELVVCEVSTFNRKEGRVYVYNAEISVLVATEDQERIAEFIKARELSIKDRVQVVIRSADPADFNDPGLESIKRQIGHELNNLLGGKELIKEVMIAKLLQSRSSL
ncbi:MAG: flagellar basal body-associated FliL family protein [Phycisphaerales bacterium]|nr:flagellar basal body-associated FliL family protein [Phycisphaerales bacterium]